jgi:hypothetical protein
MMTSKLRTAGSRWRLLAHERFPGKKMSGQAHHIEIPGTEFDELAVGRWCHIEQMDVGRWWMNIGGVTLWVDADRDGRAKSVTVFGPDALRRGRAWLQVRPCVAPWGIGRSR